LCSTAIGAVALTLTALSLTHLAAGVASVTHASPAEGWAMAVGIDALFISLELSKLMTATERVRKAIAPYVKWASLGTLAGSAAMNAYAFASQAPNPLMACAGVVMGLGVATKVGATLYIDCHTRS
jgi:hypothetical protein